MLDRLIRAFLVIGGISAAGAWTWPGVFPEADPVAVLVRYHTPNFYTAVVGWYYLAPGVAVFLTGQFIISTSRIWFASVDRDPQAGRQQKRHRDRGHQYQPAAQVMPHGGSLDRGQGR